MLVVGLEPLQEGHTVGINESSFQLMLQARYGENDLLRKSKIIIFNLLDHVRTNY